MRDVPGILRWLLDTVLPFWADVGVDPEGGFVERLTWDRTPAADGYKRIRVQARQIYAMSHGRLLGAGDWSLEAAARGYDFLTRHGWDPDGGGWVHLVTRAGAPLDRRRDCYDHAFVAMALAWYHRATGLAGPLEHARRTIAWLDDHLGAPPLPAGGWGGYREQAGPGLDPAAVLPRRQNPHMHLLEALLALHEATGEREWLDRAAAVVALAEARFLDPATGTLGEFFTADWAPAPGAEGALREPGHHFEWVWLLHQYRRLSGDRTVLAVADQLYRFGRAHGLETDPAMAPGAFDAVDPEGGILQDSKRLWVQTEYLKALVARAEFQGDAEAAALARAFVGDLFRHYVSADHAVWRDQLTRDGRDLATHIPASTLYHLFLAMAEVSRVLRL